MAKFAIEIPQVEFAHTAASEYWKTCDIQNIYPVPKIQFQQKKVESLNGRLVRQLAVTVVVDHLQGEEKSPFPCSTSQ